MSRLIAAEIRKLRTVRSTWAVTLVGLALVLLGAGTTAFGAFAPFTGDAEQTAALIDGVGGASVIPLIVALLAITTEFRHGTIGRTLQLTPSRSRVMVAKLAAAGAYATAFVLVGGVLATLLGVAGAAAEGATLTFTAAYVETGWQALVALVLTALLGAAFGALVRSQALALTVALLYIFVLENLVLFARPEIGRWLPFQALNNLFASQEVMEGAPAAALVEPLPPGVALGTFLAWVVVIAAGAVASMRYRDV